MSAHELTLPSAYAEPDTASPRRHGRDVIEAAVATACNRIAPLWPLKHFVAVNPFLGFAQQSFHATCATFHRVARVEVLMPRRYYRDAIASGRIEPVDLAAAIAAAPDEWPVPRTLEALMTALANDVTAKPKHVAHVPSVAEVLDALADGDRIRSGTAFMIDEISKWCAAYYDEGQAVWRLPGRGLPPYTAWRSTMRYDRGPEVSGITGFRAIVATLPDDPVETIAEVVRRQGVPERAVADYLHQAFVDIGGWAAYARYLRWNDELYGRTSDAMVHLLAIRLAWGYALFVQRTDPAFTFAWRHAMAAAALAPRDDRIGEDPDLCLDLVVQEAFEHAFRRRLLAQLTAHRIAGMDRAVDAGGNAPSTVQAAFCIDVRSEVFRRALEAEDPDVTTVGFAGFFGFPIEYIPLGLQAGGAQCPVLLKPAVIVAESVKGATPDVEAHILGLRLLRRRAAKAWKSFKTAAVSSFIYVEAAGLLFAAKIVGDSLALTRTVHDPDTDGLDPGVIERLGPRITSGTVGDRRTSFDPQERIAMAEAVLRAMSLTEGFAPLVLLTGHGSTTVNNPYASGLDCAACGGYTGEANARVAAAVLNDEVVRLGLREHGIAIPDGTWFLGALHDTTTDAVKIYDVAAAPARHREQIARLQAALARAGARVRAERAPQLGIAAGRDVDRHVRARSRDWSQVRPEWALAGNAAFIAAPRERTRGLDLGGRVFLHDYAWRRDRDLEVLALIMTAPMVVANWINLQYYGSTVNNRIFGSGNKTLHNVAGVIGVLEGNAGDLKVGLPWQAVHDGSRYMHEPMRLTVVIEAPLHALDTVIANHERVRELVANRWLHLFAMDDDGRVTHRWDGLAQWTALP